MTPETTTAFDLPDHLAAKADPALVAADERFLAHLADVLEARVADLTRRLEEARRAPAGEGSAAVERDLEVHRLASRLRLIRRFGIDLCLGRMVTPDGRRVYIGRTGMTGPDGEQLLVDWRAPAAEPFFAATHGDPRGLVSRRRYRWTLGRVTDYWDEVFTAEGLEHHAALDDQSAFVASLGAARTGRMRDVLATIQADQDAIVRAGSHGALVVDGGPGTGKTVVALHRAAYLLHADPRLADGRGGVLVVGPHRPYLEYVADVLPSLGEEGVATCTLRDLVPEGADAGPEPDPFVARLKADARMLDAVEPAVALYEEPPTEVLVVATPWVDVRVTARDWAEAFDAVEPGTPHNEAREEVREALLGILTDAVVAELDDGEADEDDDGWGLAEEEFDAYGRTGEDPRQAARRALAADRDLARALERAWPVLDPAELVGDLWTVPAYLRRCAPWLAPDEVTALRREDPTAWTDADLPLLDAMRRRLGDPETSARRRRQEAVEAAERERMADVVADLLATDDSDLKVMSMLRGQDLRAALVDPGALPTPTPDRLAGPFAHVVVDEAQELTDAEWQMLLQRTPSRSITVVGDRAQARHGFAEPWEERLRRVGLREVRTASLTVNYRTPEEVMDEAAPVILAALPDANVPTSVRRSGVPVHHGGVAELDDVLDAWAAQHPEGTGVVIGDPTFAGRPRVRSLTPLTAKGLEFDLVVLVDPERLGEGVAGAVDRYVAMTRATQRLAVLTSGEPALSVADPAARQPDPLRGVQPDEDARRRGGHPPGRRQRDDHRGGAGERHGPQRRVGEQGRGPAVVGAARDGGPEGEQRRGAADEEAGHRSGRREPPPPHPEHDERGEGGGGDREREPDRRRDPERLGDAAQHVRDDDGRDGGEPEAAHAGRVPAGEAGEPGAQQLLVEDPGHRHREAGRGREERRERAAGEHRGEDVPTEPADQLAGQPQHDGVRAHPGRQLGEGDPAEGAVDRRQEVEGPEEGDDRDGGAPGAGAVRVRVVADEDVRQAHRAEAQGEHGRGRAVDGVVVRAGRRERDAPLRGDDRRRVAVAEPQEEQDERGHREGGQLDPVLHGLDEGDRTHSAGADGRGDDDHDDEAADPRVGAGDEGQGEAGALELREQVQPADGHDEDRRHPADGLGPEPGLGEVGQRVRARAAHRGGDHDEQDEVAERVAHRQPEQVDAAAVDEPRDAEEARRGEVLAADGRGVEARGDRAPGDVEVARPAREAQPEAADGERRQADEHDRDERERVVHGSSTTSVKSASIRSLCRVYQRARTHAAG